MKINITLILIIIILLLIGGGFWMKNYYKNQIAEEKLELRKEKLGNDELKQIAEGHYQKLVADTLRVKDLERIVDSLNIELKAKPRIVYQIKYVPKEVEKPVDSISIQDGVIGIEDFYPEKDNYFIRYRNKISLVDSTGTGIWSFNPLSVSAVISERSDGMFVADFKTPSWLSIESVDIQATPLTPTKIDNFGWLLGVGVAKDFRDDAFYGRLSGGIRYKKIYLILGAGTNQTVGANLNFEF